MLAKLSILRTLLPRIFVSIECSLRYSVKTDVFFFSFPSLSLCFLFSEAVPVYIQVIYGNNGTIYWRASFSRLTRIGRDYRGENMGGGGGEMAVARRSLVRIINSESEY